MTGSITPQVIVHFFPEMVAVSYFSPILMWWRHYLDINTGLTLVLPACRSYRDIPCNVVTPPPKSSDVYQRSELTDQAPTTVISSQLQNRATNKSFSEFGLLHGRREIDRCPRDRWQGEGWADGGGKKACG